MTAKVKSAYEELNYPDAEEMAVKSSLVSGIADQLRARRLTQSDAAQLLGPSQPKLSNLLRGQFRGVSEKKLMLCLTKLGQGLEIVPGSRILSMCQWPTRAK